MITKGWIKMFRKVQEWEFYKDTNVKCVWLHLLINTAYEPTKLNEDFIIYPGYVVTSVRKLAAETGLSIQNVRSALKKLETAHQITQTATHKGTVIRLENWAIYQDGATSSTQEVTHEVTQYKKYNNKNNKNYNKRTNRFINHEQRTYDFEKLEKLERELLIKEVHNL